MARDAKKLAAIAGNNFLQPLRFSGSIGIVHDFAFTLSIGRGNART
jgi:hypothetical protein